MKKDFNDVFAMYKDDLEKASEKPRDDEDDEDQDEKDEGADNINDEDQDDTEHTTSRKHASLAHDSEGTAAMKAEIIAKTKQFAEAMKSLDTEDVHAMKKDFNDVFAMYQDDLAEYTTSKKHVSLAHASEGTVAMKAAIIAKTKQFAEAMESLNTEDVDAMKKDFNDVFAMYKDDLEKASEKPRDDEDDEDQDDKDEGADDIDNEDQDDTKHTTSKKHASLAHSSEGTA